MPKTARGDTRGCGTLPGAQPRWCKVLTAEPARHRNDLLKRVLLFWLVIWELCSEATPFVEQLKFAALFFFFMCYRSSCHILFVSSGFMSILWK